METGQLRLQTESEGMLRTIVESVPSGVLIVDTQGHIVLCNSEFELMLGYLPNELLGKKIEVVVPLTVREKHPDLRAGFAAHPSKRQMGAGRNLTALKKDQSEIPVEIGLNHIYFGSTMYVIAAVVDITERVRQEERFRTIVESVPNGILMTNREGKILLSNSPLEKMFGYDKGELIGKEVEVLVPQRFRSAHPNHRKNFAQDPQKRRMGAGRDLTGVKKDGQEIPVEIGLNHMSVGSEQFLLASVVDITERKVTEQKLQKAYNEVQQKNQEMEQFVYTVSHDLKAPLVTSASYMDFLKEDLEEENFEGVRDSLNRLENAHRRMKELIEDLLQLSRVGRIELHDENVSLKTLVHEVLESHKDVLESKKIQVKILDGEYTIRADSRRIYQVFENLILNATKYASDGPQPEIQIFTRRSEDELQICIKDNGPGIEPIYHKKIFGLFQRLDNKQEGTGVGLAIVARIMQLHDGKAWVDSTPPHGSEFWVSFPEERIIT
ncbi:PAS domain S-box protein [Bdellovibrio sp. HCB117]|uniref:PAS domain-containing sensor histidine kinase n=1 Tax=Bdellovibrio sp. HCB117 TaxID=3394359 RepID=UPI0039B5B2DD